MQALVLVLAATLASGDYAQGGPDSDLPVPRTLKQPPANWGGIPDAADYREAIDRQAATDRRPVASTKMPLKFAVQQAAHEESDTVNPIQLAQYGDRSTWPSGNNSNRDPNGTTPTRRPLAPRSGGSLLDSVGADGDSRAYIPPMESPELSIPDLPATNPRSPTNAGGRTTSNQIALPELTTPPSTPSAQPGRNYAPRTLIPTAIPNNTQSNLPYATGETPNTVVSRPPPQNYAPATSPQRRTTPAVAAVPKSSAPLTNPNPTQTIQRAVNNAGVGTNAVNMGTGVTNELIPPINGSRPGLEPQRSENLGLTMMALFASLGLNLYLGWIAWDTYNRYQDMVSDLRSPRRERYDRDLGRPVSTAIDDRRVAESGTY